LKPVYQKLDLLKKILSRQPKLAVAFSGGVDSTFLLSVAVEVLGVDKVRAFHLESVLQGADSKKRIRLLVASDFPSGLQFETIRVNPLDWPEFTDNPENRCYHCKKRMYSMMLARAAYLGITTLADGTNGDDMKEHRPGLKAVREMGILTPLQLAGMSKTEIRSSAQERGLSNHDLASNSCLATRIRTGCRITWKDLEVIDKAEIFLRQLGFEATRVRPGNDWCIIEMREKDMARLIERPVRVQVEVKFKELGLSNPAVRLKSR
jgi:uncharacterized protein